MGVLFCMLVGTLSSACWASVTVMGTRVVYNGTDRDVTIQLSNAGPVPALVQTWVDLGDPTAAPETIDAPFVLSPPMFRIDPNRKQNLRMVFMGRDLPKDRESLFWLNVLEIPPKPGELAGENYLQFSVRSRLKIFYRPAHLPGDPNRAVEALQWRYARDGNTGKLVVKNPTAYHVSFAEIKLSTQVKLDEDGVQEALVIGKPLTGMVNPLSQAEFVFPDLLPDAPAPLSVFFASVNDWGGYVPSKASLAGQP
jgi:P pilus assembly chaperone PapD